MSLASKPKPNVARAIIVAAVTLLVGSSSQAADPAQVKVTLFGAPCILSGPISEENLRVVHSISPERMPLPESIEQSRQTLAAAKKITSAPAGLDRYREKLLRRLDAQQAAFEGLAKARQSKDSKPFFDAIKSFQTAEKAKHFQAEFGKLVAKKKWAFADDDAIGLFNDSVDAFPEEEFHRSIQKMGIRYGCSFEAEDNSENGGEGD